MPTREQLRTFYLTGRGLEDLTPAAPLRPAVLDHLELPRLEHSYPLYFTESLAPQPFFRFLQTALGPTLRDYAELIAGAFAEQIAPRELTGLSSVLANAIAAVRTRLAMLHVPAHVAETELEALRKLLMEPGWLIPFSEATLTLLASAILQSGRKEARQAFTQQLKETQGRLQEMLEVEERKAAGPKSAWLGDRASAFLNPSALAEAFRRRTASTLPADPERRTRCLSALATIGQALHDFNCEPSVLLVALQDAELCKRKLEHYTEVLRAVRLARLELESAFDLEVHPAALEAFDWSRAQLGELAALPVVLVVATAQEVQQSLASFVQLLQSGLPVQILITAKNPADDLGCLPLAYQDVFVLHSCLASTDHLIAGLTEMARTLGPAVAVVAVSDSWTAASLVPLARSYPLYRHDPDGGGSWYQRFAFEAGPARANEQLTFAHVAAVIPEFREHFRVLPPDVGPLDAAFPSVPVIVEDGEISHAVFTGELVKICSAMESRWSLLAELAAPKVVTDVDRSGEERARLDGATRVIHRVISILSNG